MNKALQNYTKELLKQNKSIEAIRQNLLSAGWKENDVDQALSTVSSSPALPTVPPPLSPEKISMVEIFVNFLSFILLGIVATSLGVLYFQIINRYFPDILAEISYGRNIRFRVSAVHYSIASLIVGFPLYVWALWFWFKGFKKAHEKAESRLTKWITYIVLLAASVTIIGDLIAAIFSFLQGELSTRFLLKALTILVITGLIFIFYFLERKKIHYKKEVTTAPFRALLGISVVLVIAGIVFGFFAAGTPGQERLRKFDRERVRNLQSIGNGIDRFARDNLRLPDSLDEFKNNTRYNFYVSNTTDPVTKKVYEYRPLSTSLDTPNMAFDFHYELCGIFALSTIGESYERYPKPEFGSWEEHGQGKVCKTQTITVLQGEGGILEPRRLPPVPRD